MINEAEVFIFLDDVQWTKRDWRNRNRIRTPQGWTWLNVPVKLSKSKDKCKINEVTINYSQKWQKKHLETTRRAYKKSPYFNEVFSLMKDILNQKFEFIVDLNYELILEICKYLEIKKTRFQHSQDMNIPNEVKKSEKLLFILKKIGKIDTYISGPAAKSYLEENKFQEIGINIMWHEYKHPYYRQNVWNSNVFISHLSIVDLLFNHGKDSLEILSGRKMIKKPEKIKVQSPEAYKN